MDNPTDDRAPNSAQPAAAAGRANLRWLYLLLIIPFIATLWVPFYAGTSPALAGIPYFYWYQFLWVIITAVLTAVVYFIAD